MRVSVALKVQLLRPLLIYWHIYPSHLKVQDYTSRERISTKALIEDETMDSEGRAKQNARAKNG